jgi:hypothetical protein
MLLIPAFLTVLLALWALKPLRTPARGLALAALCGAMILAPGCGGGGGGGTTTTPSPSTSTGTAAGTYTVTVTASSGNRTQQLQLTLKVN